LWASKSVLIRNCRHFETLFGSDFDESKPRTDAQRSQGGTRAIGHNALQALEEEEEVLLADCDSDFDLDEALPEDAVTKAWPADDFPHHRIRVQNNAYSTYGAVLMWIQTGYISFAPLHSSFSHLPLESRSLARITAIESLHELEPQLPLSVSPKSVYKLAHYLSLPVLESLALQELSRQLTVDNVFTELFDGLASVYEEVRKLEVEFAVRNKKEVVETKGFKDVMDKLRKNELSFSGPVVADLLPLLVG
jgi:hypothetical protein